MELFSNDTTAEAWLAEQRWGNEPTVYTVPVIMDKLAHPIQ